MMSLFRAFIASWKNVFREAWIGAATTFVFWLVLLSVNALLGVQVLLEHSSQGFEDRVDVTMTFRPGAPEPTLNQIRLYALSLPQVKSAELVTQDQALQKFRDRYSQNPKVLAALEEVNGNPLGAQLVIKAKQLEDYAAVVQALQNPQYQPFIQSQTYTDHRSAIDNIRFIAERIRFGGSVLIAAFALFGILIVMNAVRVAVYTQREEIAIMRLVGASAWFVRAPFILQVIWYGLFAFLLVMATTYAGAVWMDTALITFGGEPILQQALHTHAWALVLGECALLCAVLAGTAWIAVGRYMKR